VIRSRLATAASRRLLVLAAAAMVVVLAGCEAGNNAPTTQWHQSTAGTDQMTGDISISDVFVLGAPIGQKVPTGGSASVFLALYNGGSADKLTSISAPGTARSVTLLRGPVSLASQRQVLLTGPVPEVVLNDLTQSLSAGSTIKLALYFQNASSAVMMVPVMPRAADYSTYFPPPTPTPTPTVKAKTKAKASATPSPGATPTPSASPSATP
jgi:copper(I)-binding protein